MTDDFAKDFARMVGGEPEKPGDDAAREADKPDVEAQHQDLARALFTPESPAEKRKRERALIESLHPESG